MSDSSTSSIKRRQLGVGGVQAVGVFLVVLGFVFKSSALAVFGVVIFAIGVAAGIEVIVTARRAKTSGDAI
jgi:VIT1/CCC1 family predicted Fe2+/Mn2+ transporter